MNKDFKQWLMDQQYTWAQKGMIGVIRYTWVDINKQPNRLRWIIVEPKPLIYDLW